jgi:2-polyprenyl-3-methyl-5-hydroxy-6-metoxy-1,4-benzoquinol methylase
MTSHPSIEEQAEHYDNWNKECRDDRYEDIHQEIKARADEILEAIEAQRVPTGEILEIGCGTGWFTEKLSRLGNVTAVDLSPRAIEIAKGRDTGAQFTACNILDHDFGEKRFDLIVCVETLFYVEDVDRLVKKMADLCSDRGYLAVTTINKFVYERSNDVGPPGKGQIRNWLSRRETLELIQRFFDVTSVTTVEPRGNLGILRLVNSYKVNGLLERFVDSNTIKRAKERLGLGGGIVIIALKKPSQP